MLSAEFKNHVIHIWPKSLGDSEQAFISQPAHCYEDELGPMQQIHTVYALI